MGTNRHQKAGRARAMQRGFAIDPDSSDVRLALKRAIWTSGFTIKEVSELLGMHTDHIERTLGSHGNAKGKYHTLTPGLLNRIVHTIKLTDYQARRMHMLGAREAGWDVGLREIIPPAAQEQAA